MPLLLLNMHRSRSQTLAEISHSDVTRFRLFTVINTQFILVRVISVPSIVTEVKLVDYSEILGTPRLWLTITRNFARPSTPSKPHTRPNDLIKLEVVINAAERVEVQGTTC